MQWDDFVTAVKDRLHRDGDDTNPDIIALIDKSIISAVVDLQRTIPSLRVSNTVVMGESDFDHPAGFVSVGQLPDGYIADTIRVDPLFSSQSQEELCAGPRVIEMKEIPWKPQFLFPIEQPMFCVEAENGQIVFTENEEDECIILEFCPPFDEQKHCGRVCFTWARRPHSRDFLIFPSIKDTSVQVMIRYSAIVRSFGSTDDTPFEEDVAEAVSLFVNHRLFLRAHEKRTIAQDFYSQYLVARRDLYLDYRDQYGS